MKEPIRNLFASSLDQNLQTLTHSDEFISPRYEGESILNILPSIGQLFGISGFQHPTLVDNLMSSLKKEPQQVILILMDALAYHRLENWLTQDQDLIWHQFQEGGVFKPLTSICPSTTSAAITAYWTDSAAIEHGILGYEMWLKEYGITANMIEHKPITYRSPGGGLALAGFDPESFLPVNSIAGKLNDNDIEVHAFQHYAIINSGMSEMFMGPAIRHPIGSASDLWISIRELLESEPATRKYIWAYWSQLDSTSHLHGPDSERARAEFINFSRDFEMNFWSKLNRSQKENTLVILTADHGQITTDPNEEEYDLRNHPRLTEMLHLLPTGENRLAYLHAKPGRIEQVKEYIHQTWPEGFVVFERDDFLQAGLFGPGKEHPAIPDRLGDLILAARGDAYWWWGQKPNPLIGRHGGFSVEEMLVPFLAG